VKEKGKKDNHGGTAPHLIRADRSWRGIRYSYTFQQGYIVSLTPTAQDMRARSVRE
jgi:hypothetical protein